VSGGANDLRTLNTSAGLSALSPDRHHYLRSSSQLQNATDDMRIIAIPHRVSDGSGGGSTLHMPNSTSLSPTRIKTALIIET
jgi:hypothetical protein